MATLLKLSVVTPEGTPFVEDVSYVSLPTEDGQIGVYPSHTPLVATLVPGEVRSVLSNGVDHLMAVGAGFVEVTGTKVSILTDSAVDEDHIDLAEVEAAIKRAQDALSHQLSDEEMSTTEAALARSMAQLRVKQRRRSI